MIKIQKQNINTSLYFINIKKMGNDCLATTPNEKYERFLSQVKVSELKDLWETVKIYKIKKLFDAAAIPHPDYKNVTHLDFEGFSKLFPQLQNYPQQQVHRLFQIFDIEDQGFVDWNSFFSSITICYFCSERILGVLMFMMFDYSLELQLDGSYLRLMLETNEPYFKAKQDDQEYQVQEVITALKASNGLSIDLWAKSSQTFIDFIKFRKIFNIFTEQKMQKQLVKYFYEWNTIYDDQKQKYIGYLINFKWFQSWRLYILQQYNFNIEVYATNRPTIKTLKTCKKTMSKFKSTNKLGFDTGKSLHGCRSIQIPRPKDENQIKDIDCVHNHLGQRPRQISNGQLEGEFEEVLRSGVTENMDYVIVSQKIWNHLKGIYDGYPQFRRTGFDAIELYPKIVKVYFSLFKQQIDYSTQVIREVSAYLRVDHLLTRSCQIPEGQIPNKIIYFKTIGMTRWEELEDPTYLFTELSSEILIFLVCLPANMKQIFKKSHQKVAKEVTQLNLGDYFTYKTSTGVDKTAAFMGKSTEGKYILHFVGESHSNDLCLLESQLIKNCKLKPRLLDVQQEKRLSHTGLCGLPNGPGLGFINSIFLQLFNIKELKGQLIMFDSSRDDLLIYNLAKLNALLMKQARIESIDIKELVQNFLSQLNDFDVSMCYQALEDILTLFSNELKQEEMPDFIQKFVVKLDKEVTCKHCKTINKDEESAFILKIPIPQKKLRYFQVVWVPCNTKAQVLKYSVKVPASSTLGDFMDALEQQIGVKDKQYILTEVQGFDIIKNYHSASRKATLQNLKLRQTDQLYAFELFIDLKEFVSSSYNNRELIDQDQMKKDQFIDCKHAERGWIFGKVIEIQYLPYTQSSLVKVLHKFNKNQSWEISYDVFEGSVARFPLKCYSNCQQYYLRIQQRIFNEASNTMQLVNIPLVIVMPSWMRWKQFFYFVFLQIRRFVADEYNISDKLLEQKPVRKTAKSSRKETIKGGDKFKEYKTSEKFPYALRLSDYEGRCAICFKFLKSVIFKGENELYCEGCPLSQVDPISWQVKPADLLICVDWIGPDRFVRDIVRPTKSLNSKATELKSQEETLVNCISRLTQPAETIQQSLCCNVESPKSSISHITQTGDQLIIYLERIFQEKDGFKQVLNRPIKIEIKDLKVGGKKYDLTGVTSIQGEHFNIRYKTYTLKGGDQWYEYDGKLVRVVDSKYLEKVCAFVLYYHKAAK